MLAILLKSSACLAIFMLFYKLCLEKTSAHTFKRFYLIGVLIVSIGIPFITFTEYVEVEVQPSQSLNFSAVENYSTPQNVEIIETKTLKDYLPTIFWSVYAIGVVLFSFRFFKNLYQLFSRIKSNPKYKNKNFVFVLLRDIVTPHTFFNYIFLNKTNYEQNKIPKEVLLHEQTHAKQKHALDILYIEMLQILFWFNPLLYFIKKDIKLNHEFLADREVLKLGIDSSTYQNTLLSFSLPNDNSSQSSLANALNYSSIKKRFKIMTTKTSNKDLIFRTLLLIPILAFSIYGFSQKETSVKNNTSISVDTIKEIKLHVKSESNLILNDKPIEFKNLTNQVNAINPSLTPEQKQNFLIASIIVENDNLLNFAKEISTDLSQRCNIGVLRVINIETYNNSNQNSYLYSGKTVKEAQEILDKKTINLSPPKKSNSPWKVAVGINTAEISDIVLNDGNKQQKRVSKEEIDEYNALARNFNAKPEDKRSVKLTDFGRLLELYSMMNGEQKTIIEPFPSYMTPPKSDEQIIREMIKNGTTSYINDKKATSEKAIALIDEKIQLKVSTENKDGNTIIKMHTRE